MHSLSDHEQQKVDEFFALSAAGEGAYGHANFSFIAVSSSDGLELAQGHVILPVGSNVPPTLEVITPSICGCSVLLSDLGVDYRGLISALVSGGIDTPIGRLRFACPEGMQHAPSAYIERFPANFYTSFLHPLHLSISFASHLFMNRQAEFQNDLRAGVKPYDSVIELANELGLRPLRWDVCSLDISAHTLVGVDLRRRIRDGIAHLAMLAAHGIDLAPARLGYRIQTAAGKVIERRAVDADSLQWSDSEDVRVGEFTVTVPEGALIQCFASYRGQWTHQGWIVNPDTSVNPRRVAHEVFDADMNVMKKYLFDPKQLKQNARQLEAGVANLLFMHGFAVNPLAGQYMTDAADLLAVTPTGNFIVVECTTGAIDNDGKLSKLLARTALLSERLRLAGHAHLKCLPVVATTLARDATTDLAVAAEKGIVVLTAEDLQQAVEDTLLSRDADRLFDTQWAAVHPTQDSLFPTEGFPLQG